MKKMKPYFEGWYFKQSTDKDTLSVIPSYHINKDGEMKGMLQLITKKHSFVVEYPMEECCFSYKPFYVRMGKNKFSKVGIHLDINEKYFKVKGALTYWGISPLKIDIMGPFRYVPCMQCRHKVISMWHEVKGKIQMEVKGWSRTMNFNKGIGYIEGDRGSSFPKDYLWIQCNQFPKETAAVMLSIADIPIGKRRFLGCISSVICNGKEHRLATYYGAKVIHWSSKGAIIRQGRYRLVVKVKPKKTNPLLAPKEGEMSRQINESVVSHGRVLLIKDKKVIFDSKSKHISMEYYVDTTR